MIELDIQRVSVSPEQPDDQQLRLWVAAALADRPEDGEIVIRIVDDDESAELNEQYRRKPGPTNILSFPFEPPDIAGLQSDLLGDLVICAPVLEREALAQHKNLNDHWAHIVVHGVLHLLGYDHSDADDAERMEQREIAILATLNINNPYLDEQDDER